MADRTADGRPIRMLTIVDEFTRECLAIDVAKKLTSEDVLERLSDLFIRRGVPEHIRSDNRTTTPFARTVPWGIDPRLPRRSSPVQSPRLRLGNCTGLV